MNSNNLKNLKILEFCNYRNNEKTLFTAGPASLLSENIEGLQPCFGRDDDLYYKAEERVLTKLKTISCQTNIARFQGSASLALEIISLNFLYGKVLIIDSGYYSDRLKLLANTALKTHKNISKVNSVSWSNIENVDEKYDWIFFCYNETSSAILLPIKKIKSLADKINAKIAMDATASIGLEKYHDLADVVAFSSCKGLFGLTGASFVAFSIQPQNEVNSFYLDIKTHLEKKITGPYHSILSLDKVLENYENFKESVLINKKKFLRDMNLYLSYSFDLQPSLCTYVNIKLISENSNVILYKPRNNIQGSIVCHLGEAHLGKYAKGNILKLLKKSNL
jgi:aspartate aminotransferase-like enzyme